MRRFLPLLSAGALALLLVGPPAVSANNDPHRIPFPAAPFALSADYCGFPVTVDFPVNGEYAKVSDDGLVYAITGPWVARVSRNGTAMSIELDIGGPGVATFAADFSSVTEHLLGRTFLYATNLTGYGFPSNFVATAGPVTLSWDFASGAYTSFSGHPRVITDVCAALS
jgi:hypothetical protein